MHEGDHGIVDHDDEPHAHHADRRGRVNRLISMVVVGAAVLIFLVWRFF